MGEKRPEEDKIVQEEYSVSDSDALSINDAARGDNLPDNYFMSFSFIGTVLVCKSENSPTQLLTTDRAFVWDKLPHIFF